MSNPLLRPNDPRFAKPSITDDAGQNRFGDNEQETDEQSPADVFAAPPAADQELPYQPRYETTAPSRGGWLVGLATLGIAGVLVGGFSLTGLAMTGWIWPLLGSVASVAAWLLAHSDLAEMRSGGRDESGRTTTRVAMWLGIFGLVLCAVAIGGMIWWGLSLLPDFL
jgi:hypothetical protein